MRDVQSTSCKDVLVLRTDLVISCDGRSVIGAGVEYLGVPCNISPFEQDILPITACVAMTELRQCMGGRAAACIHAF